LGEGGQQESKSTHTYHPSDCGKTYQRKKYQNLPIPSQKLKGSAERKSNHNNTPCFNDINYFFLSYQAHVILFF
jgi:hypothetical protein